MSDKDFDNILKEERLSFFQRLLNIFINPTKVMESILVKPTVLIPILLILAIFSLLNVARFELFKEFSTQLMGQGQDPQVSELSQEITMMSMYTGMIVASIAPLLGIMFKGALVFGIVQLLGGKGKFKSNISVLAFSYFILALGEIIRTIIGLLTETYMVTTSLAAVFPKLQIGTPLYALLGSLDVFSIWYLIVSMMGVSIVNGINRSKAAIAVFVPWILLLGYNVAMAVIGTMFQM